MNKIAPLKADFVVDVIKGHRLFALFHGPGLIVFSLCIVSSTGT